MTPNPTDSFNAWLIASEPRAQFCKSLAADAVAFAQVMGADGNSGPAAVALLALLLRSYAVSSGILVLDSPWPDSNEQSIDWTELAAWFVAGIDDII